jgi:TPP-dependent pyruvate/acetoin dehydrogenase alpha subunit
LIEAYCYRIKAHGTADDPSLYRDESEVERWLALEPVGRMAAFLRRQGIIDDAKEAELHDEVQAVVARAVAEMEAIDHPGRDILFEHVYASGRPWTYGEAMAELQSVRRPPQEKPPGSPTTPGAGAEGKTQ